LVPVVDEVWASPYARAWRTAELLHEEAGWPPPKRFRALEAPRSALETVGAFGRSPLPERVAAVGHEPNLSEVASVLLAGGPDEVAVDLKKGGAIGIVFDGAPEPGSGLLRWVLTPKTLRWLAR